MYCRSLQSVVIGDGVITIADHAFRDCSSLISLTMGKNVTYITEYAFESVSLTSFVVPIKVTTIPEGLFYNSRSLSSLKIHDGVTSIGNGAFYGCSLTCIIWDPSILRAIGPDALPTTSACPLGNILIFIFLKVFMNIIFRFRQW